MKRSDMSNNDELKNKITNWLLEESITFSQVPDEAVDFRLRINFGGYFIDLLKLKGMKRLATVGNLAFHEKTIMTFARLTKKEKHQFLSDLYLKLIRLRSGFSIQPVQPQEIETIASILIDDVIFLDDLTKTSLFDSIMNVKRSMMLANFASTRLLNIDLSTQNSSINTAGMG
jgi:hypothetical protein